MKRALYLSDVGLISLFAVASGVFKVVGGKPDLEVFAHLGMNAAAVAAFGAVQVIAGVLTAVPRTRRPGALALALCNALATAGLFAAGVQPFGAISTLFIAMAALPAWQPVAPERARL